VSDNSNIVRLNFPSEINQEDGSSSILTPIDEDLSIAIPNVYENSTPDKEENRIQISLNDNDRDDGKIWLSLNNKPGKYSLTIHLIEI